MEYWACREKNGNLSLFVGEKPYTNGLFWMNGDYGYGIDVDNEEFLTEVTFENSPQRVEIKLI